MSLLSIMDIAGSGMTAQMTRLNVIASNLSNQDSISGDKESAYHARYPVFETVMQEEGIARVRVSDIVEAKNPLKREFQPGNPMADEEGYVYMPNVNSIEEMADMISASRSYQDNVQVIEAAKNMALKTLQSLEQ